MEQEEKKEIELKCLETLPKSTTQELLTYYCNSLNMEGYAKMSFVVISVLFLIHNIFIAGKSYPIDTYDTIMTTELSIVGLILLFVIILAIIAMSKISHIKMQIEEHSKKHAFTKEELAKEFSALAVHLYGGRGVNM